MGLFSWLFGSSPRVAVADQLWQTDAALLRAVVRDLDDRWKQDTVLLLAHFPATLAAVRAELDARGIAHTPFPPGMTPPQLLRAADPASPPLLTGLVHDLRPDPFPDPESGPGPPVLVVVAERHFLRRHDDAVVQFAGQLGGRERVTFHSSLDAPLMKQFAGEWVAGVLRQLGMKDDEAITSEMVTRRVKAAQGKVAARVVEELPADSAEDWARINLGGG